MARNTSHMPIVMVEPSVLANAKNYWLAAEQLSLRLFFLSENKGVLQFFPSHAKFLDTQAPLSDIFSMIKAWIGEDFHLFTESEIHLKMVRSLQDMDGYSGLQTLKHLIIPRSKSEMKALFALHQIPHARGVHLSVGEDRKRAFDLSFPLIVKPESGMSSCGVVKCHDEASVFKALRQVELFNSVIMKKFDNDGLGAVVEEFMDGQEYAVDTIWQQGKPVFDFVLSRGEMNEDTFPDDLYYYDPNISSNVKSSLIALSRKCGEVMKVKNGATHTEMRVNSKGEVKVIETTPRSGAGGLFHLLYSRAAGFNTAVHCLAGFAKKPAGQATSVGHADRYIGFYQPIIKRKGILERVEGVEALRLQEGYVDSVAFIAPGERWGGSDMNLKYSIWFLLEANTHLGLQEAIQTVDQHVRWIWTG